MNKNNLLKCPDPQNKFKECPIRKMALYRDVPEDELGWLSLFKILYNGKRQILRFILPGDFFGFQVDGIGPAAGYMHGSQALMESTLCAFPVARFRSMMQKQPQLTTRLAEMEMHDMNLCQHHLICAGRKNAQESILFFCWNSSTGCACRCKTAMMKPPNRSSFLSPRRI
jgi:hypothetical protein